MHTVPYIYAGSPRIHLKQYLKSCIDERWMADLELASFSFELLLLPEAKLPACRIAGVCSVPA